MAKFGSDSTGDAGGRARTAGARARVLIRPLAALVGAAALLWVVYTGLTWDLRGLDEAAAAHRSVPVIRGELPERVVATGFTQPLARVVVQSEIPGIVAAVHVDDGDRVERGEPLVELDRERIEHRVAELRAALDRQRALARLDLVGRAKAELRRAQRNHDRIEQLFGTHIISGRQRDEVQTTLELAEIGVRDAHAELAARKAAAAQARQVLRRAEQDLEKSVVRSPSSGVVVRREVEVGSAVADIENGGTVIAVIADDGRIHLLADVDENDIARVRVDQLAEVRIDAFPGELFEGHVRKVSSSGTAVGSIANFEVEIELSPDERIRIGMSADARIEVRRHRDALIVPNAAIVRTAEGPKVRVSIDGSLEEFELVPIDETYSDGFQTAVRRGLSEGDLVLVRSGHELP